MYGNGDYPAAITKLNSVKELLGSTNPRVEYLLTQSYFSNKDAVNAEASMKLYFDMADESDPNYSAMLIMIERIEELKAVALIKAQEQIDWQETQSAGIREAYEVFLETYPTGKYEAKARAELDKFPLVDERNGQKYQKVRLNGMLWMQENLNLEMDGSSCYDDLGSNCQDYGRIYDMKSDRLCPKGWRLPTVDEFLGLLSSYGANLEAIGPILKRTKDLKVIGKMLDSGSWSISGSNDGFRAISGGVYSGNMKGKNLEYGREGELTFFILEDGYAIFNVADSKRTVKDISALKSSRSEFPDRTIFGYCRCVKDE